VRHVCHPRPPSQPARQGRGPARVRM